jgi:hypothetical protein
MSRLPPGIELRAAGPGDADAICALLHDQMSSRISRERWRRLFDYPWLADKPDCGVVVLERGRVAGYLGVVYADRRLRGRTFRTGNLSSWYIVRSLRGQGLGLAMVRYATRDGGVTYTTFSSNPPALRLTAEVGLVLLDESRFLWRRTDERTSAIEVLSGFAARRTATAWSCSRSSARAPTSPTTRSSTSAGRTCSRAMRRRSPTRSWPPGTACSRSINASWTAAR